MPVQKSVILDESACGAGFSFDWSVSGSYGELSLGISGSSVGTVTIGQLISYPAQPLISYEPVVTYFERTYTLVNLSNGGLTLEVFTLPEGPVTVVSGASTCHNSGGG